jgi:hypothetical protein
MPSTLHETLRSRITQELILQLRTIAQSSSPSAIFADNIGSYGSAEIVSKDSKYGLHQPDDSFQHHDAQYPGVILELSYSQKKKDLPRLADAYILGSDADIRVVVGIDVEYQGSKKASVSIWRPHIGVDATGETELSVIQTVTDEVCSPTFKMLIFCLIRLALSRRERKLCF